MRATLIYADVYGVENRRLLDDTTRLSVVMHDACRLGGAAVLRTVGHKFSPQGVTVAAVLAESHAVLHTYPEHGSYMIDICTCGETASPLDIAVGIMAILGGTGKLHVVKRGNDD